MGMVMPGIKVAIYGQEGVGKTTFASKFPDPLFIDTEGSTRWLNPQPARFPKIPKTYREFLGMLEEIRNGQRRCQTIVIDTVDWLETLLINDLCEEKGWDGLGSQEYGKSYQYLEEKFKRLLNQLQDFVDEGFNVCLCAHEITKTFTKPNELGSWDRYELKLQKKCSSALKEWVDLLIFAEFKDMVVAQKNGSSTVYKGTGGTIRKMHTQRTASFDAKNRMNLPNELDLDFSAIAHLFTAQKSDPTPVSIPASVPKAPENEAPKIPSEQTVPVIELDSSWRAGVSPNLLRLMDRSDVTEEMVRQMTAAKGFFPFETPISQYPAGYIDSMASNWEKILNFMKENNIDGLPF